MKSSTKSGCRVSRELGAIHNALWAEFLSQNDVSIENDFSGVFLVGTKSLVEAELMQIEKIRKVERNIAELAVASCNSKGLYE